ncbi:MAG: hypothetical protein V5A82_13160 [Haloferacaceae archaeon]
MDDDLAVSMFGNGAPPYPNTASFVPPGCTEAADVFDTSSSRSCVPNIVLIAVVALPSSIVRRENSNPLGSSSSSASSRSSNTVSTGDVSRT